MNPSPEPSQATAANELIYAVDDQAWSKVIPRGRDRLQSRVLVGIGAPVLCAPCLFVLYHVVKSSPAHHPYLVQSLAISVTFALAAWALRAATPAAAAAGGMICLCITVYTGYTGSSGETPWHSGLVPLFVLFVTTFGATRAGRARKARSGLAESKRGRTASQIIANLGIAGILAVAARLIFDAFWPGSLYRSEELVGSQLLVLAALAEATADTVSSEIGQAFGGQPWMLTTLRRVPAGTDGAITVLGTLAGIGGAALIAATGAPAMGMSAWGCGVAFAAGVAGLFFDSLLGATVERRGWLGNDLVNFVSTAFAAGVALAAIRVFDSRLFR